MLNRFLILLLYGTLIVKQFLLTNANECAINTECKSIDDCPRILKNFHSIQNKPYCNLDQGGTHVCCPKPPEKYTQAKDEHVRTVRDVSNTKNKFSSPLECKSYQKYRSSCDKTIIVGGNMTAPKEFPFMALLFYRIENGILPICSGTLISNKYVLTAAHCFYISKIPTTVRLGELDWSITSDDAQPIDYEIQNIITHPEYFTGDIPEKYNDIALVELSKEVQFNDYILPACLPLVDGREFKEYLAAGWGAVNDNELTKHMFKVKLDHFDDDTCINKIERRAELSYGVNKTTQMCAGFLNGTHDTCHGDSGGPLFVEHPDYSCLFLVVGITSFEHGLCYPGYPAVYTRIQSYLDWIEEIVWTQPAKLS